MKRQIFNLPEIQLDGLKEIAKETGLNLSETARRAFSEFLDRWRNKKKNENTYSK